jgi:hypothetical protein
MSALRIWPMLTKKYPKRNCGIEFWNYRIEADGLLNQDCAFALARESMLLVDPAKNPFFDSIGQ